MFAFVQMPLGEVQACARPVIAAAIPSQATTEKKLSSGMVLVESTTVGPWTNVGHAEVVRFMNVSAAWRQQCQTTHSELKGGQGDGAEGEKGARQGR